MGKRRRRIGTDAGMCNLSSAARVIRTLYVTRGLNTLHVPAIFPRNPEIR